MVNEEEISLKFLYEELNKWKTELRISIETSEAKILHKFGVLEKKLGQLEKENCELKKEIEYLRRDNNKNNFLIFGLDKKPQDPSAEFVGDTIKELLGVTLTVSDINNCYWLGRSTQSPLKVELTTYLRKQLILKNCRKLRGTGVTIAHDLTKKQREELRELRTYLSRFKNPEDSAFVRGNKLIAGGIRYTLEDLKNLPRVSSGETHRELSTATEDLETSVSKMRDRFETGNRQAATKPMNKKDTVSGLQKKNISDFSVDEARDRLRSRPILNKADKHP